jgi:hypothetical protein
VLGKVVIRTSIVENADEGFTAQNRADRVAKFVREFHANNNLVRPNLMLDEQTEVAKQLASAIFAYDSAKQEVESAKFFDKWAVEGREARLFNAVLACDKLIINAKALGMIPPDADIVRKLAECDKKRADLESRLNLASRRISNLENLLRLHGIQVPRPDTLEGDVE